MSFLVSSKHFSQMLTKAIKNDCTNVSVSPRYNYVHFHSGDWFIHEYVHVCQYFPDHIHFNFDREVFVSVTKFLNSIEEQPLLVDFSDKRGSIHVTIHSQCDKRIWSF